MKKVGSINDKIAFRRRRDLLEKIDFNPDAAVNIWKRTRTANKTENVVSKKLQETE